MLDRTAPSTQPLPKITPPPPPPVEPKAAKKPLTKLKLAGDTMELAGLAAAKQKPVEPPKNMDGDARKLWREAIEKAGDPEFADRLWTADRPLSEGVNAHKTNTAEDMKEALESDHGYNWLEGDVRFEINDKNKVEMRHDETHEPGNNLTLREWLEIGNASGKGLKLDFKEGGAIPEALRTIKDIGIPEHRIMMNVGDGNAEKYGELIRKELPNATIALNPTDSLDGKSNADGPYEDWQLDRMIGQAEKLGQPVAFVLRNDRVTPEIVEKLEKYGPVSIWNSPATPGVENPEARKAELQKMGVTGVIDLRKSLGLLDKIEAGLDWVEGQAVHYTETAKEKVEDVAEDVFDKGKDLVEDGAGLVKKGLDAINPF